MALPLDSGVCGLELVCHGRKGQDGYCCPLDCLNEGRHQEPVGYVQWSTAGVCLCPQSHSVSGGKNIALTCGYVVVSQNYLLSNVFVEARRCNH